MQSMNTAPRTGEKIRVYYKDGTDEAGVYWSDERYCIIGPPQGARGPGWVSTDADDLPVDEEDMVGWAPT